MDDFNSGPPNKRGGVIKDGMRMLDSGELDKKEQSDVWALYNPSDAALTMVGKDVCNNAQSIRYGASQCGPLNNALNPTLGLKTSFIALIFRYIPLHTFGANHFYKGGNQK